MLLIFYVQVQSTCLFCTREMKWEMVVTAHSVLFSKLKLGSMARTCR